MEQQTFYSPRRGLIITMSTGEMAIGEDGKARRYGERHIQFRSNGDQFGAYSTSKEDEIEFLKDRAKNIRPKDVYTLAEYRDSLISAEQKADNASRVLEEQNKLLADLRRETEELKRQLEEAQAKPKTAARSK